MGYNKSAMGYVAITEIVLRSANKGSYINKSWNVGKGVN